MKKIAFDIDGTVIDLDTPLMGYFKRMYDIDLPPEAFSRAKIEDVTNIPYEKVLACVNACIEDIYAQNPYPNAVDFIRRYYYASKGKIIFITNRWDSYNTFRLLDRFFPDIFYDVRFVKGSKISDLQLEKTDIYIEDRIENAEEISNAGIFTILLERPWNQFGSKGSDKLTRVKDWYEIEELWEKIGR